MWRQFRIVGEKYAKFIRLPGLRLGEFAEKVFGIRIQNRGGAGEIVVQLRWSLFRS
jgi:hypothetical protein